jgi:exopolysaccharide production protein ExoQ
MNETRSPLELMVLASAALVRSGGVLPFVLDAQLTGTDGNPRWQLALAITYFVVLVVLLRSYRETFFALQRNWTLVSLLVLAVVSSLWADIPDLVFRRSMGLVGATLFGIALAVRISFLEQLRMLKWLLRILAVLSLACVVLLPSYGISSEGEWMGVFNYKNALGSAMGLALLVEWQLPAISRLSKGVKLVAMMLYGVLLLHSDSVTPLVALIGMASLLNIYKFTALKLRVPLYAVFLITGAIISAGLSFVIGNSDAVMGLLGRSSNLTGRTEIWSLAASFIPQKAILGYGYSGFWMGGAPESYVINRIMHGTIMYSHNGYLEMFLSLGVVGFLLTLVLLGVGMKRALYLSKQREVGLELWPLAFLLYFLLHNMGECTILQQNLEWAICVSCIVGTDLLLLAPVVEEEVEAPLVPLEGLS